MSEIYEVGTELISVDMLRKPFKIQLEQYVFKQNNKLLWERIRDGFQNSVQPSEEQDSDRNGL